MRLINLKIKMFKGFRSFDFSPDGQSVNVYGENASGKTSLADAVAYLLFDKDTQDKSPANFGIKTLENGKPLHGEEHTVEGTFELETGEQVSLRKVYSEKWAKRRGSHDSELTGHTTAYYIDDEPVSAGDYKDRIEQIMPEQLFKMLTLPNYFAEVMHWSERRKVLTELCGHIKDEDIIAIEEGLNGYPELLDGKSQEGMKKILRERKKKLNDELDNVPSRIDENNQKIVEPEQSVKDAQEKIDTLKGGIEQKREKLSEAQSGGGVSDLKVKIQEIEAEKAKARNEHSENLHKALTGTREKVSELQDLVDSSEEELRTAQREYTSVKSQVEEKEELLDQLAGDIEVAQDQQPEPKPTDDGPKVCPMCEQPMPNKGEHEDHYEKYVSEFNAKKAKRLKELRSNAEAVQAQSDELFKTLKEKEQTGSKIKARADQRKTALQKAQAELESKKKEAPEFSTETFDTKQKALQGKIDEIQLSKQSLIDGIKKEITDLESRVEEYQKVIRQHHFNADLRKRNEELRAMLKKYGDELNDVEAGLNLIEDFNRAKAGYITDRVNDMFSIVTWRLFKEQVNGGMTEVADPVVGGIPFSEGLNNAARIKAGLDIISTLSKFYQKSAPCFIDNAEGITEIPDYGMQLISLYVSGGDRKLRVEAIKNKIDANNDLNPAFKALGKSLVDAHS